MGKHLICCGEHWHVGKFGPTEITSDSVKKIVLTNLRLILSSYVVTDKFKKNFFWNGGGIPGSPSLLPSMKHSSHSLPSQSIVSMNEMVYTVFPRIVSALDQ